MMEENVEGQAETEEEKKKNKMTHGEMTGGGRAKHNKEIDRGGRQW